MNKKLYLPIAVCVIGLAVYLFGFARGRDKCIKQIATQTATISQQQTIKKEKINAETYRTGVNNIRDILRAKYTITD